MQRPDRPTTLPGKLPNRPTTLPGKLPDRPTTLPGKLPELPGKLPNRPTTLPGKLPNLPDLGNRPGIVDRPGLGNRPGRLPDIDFGNVNLGNNNILNNRPSWVNIDNNRFTQINNQFGNQIGGLHGWGDRHPDRIGYWNSWGNGVRNHWSGYRQHPNWFGPSWWGVHPHRFGCWHYTNAFNRYPWVYWWSTPTYVGLTDWFSWSAPATVWSEPIYYDYGAGGNVVVNNDQVYVNDQPIATVAEYAQSAAALATVPAPDDDEAVADDEWMPLGTFALTTDPEDVAPTRVVQLAVNKQGVISGTLYNRTTDQAVAIQGQVDKETQRVAIRWGESETEVAETGLYNLTQDEVPVMVHFGQQQTQTYLLVRLPEPDESEDDN